MASSRPARVTLIAFVLGVGVLVGAPAGADEAVPGHCVAVLDTSPAAAARQAAAPQRPQVRCFATFSEAFGWASGQRPDADAQPPHTVSAAAAPSRVLGVLHQHVGFGGGSLTLAGSAPCGRGAVARYDLSGLFNDVTSSAEARSGCRQLVLYEHANATGAFVTCSPSCSWVGAAMNDRASAVVVKG
jgi:hypothetical protein